LMARAEGEVVLPGYGAFGPAGREKQQPMAVQSVATRRTVWEYSNAEAVEVVCSW